MNRLTLDRAKSLLAAARDINILVVGDLMLDVYLQGTALRISPEAPVPVTFPSAVELSPRLIVQLP